jgi:hypothetical protein
MATQEARALLDSLMGGDRNAPLPKGAAVPSKKRSSSDAASSSQLLLPGKRQKSCYDKDIDPLYTAWGIDVYDLFVNTKSDVGTNPYVVDEAAHKEFISLPIAEQERLGYHYFLFQKLNELVRQCDRTVNRNKEKLRQEVSRKLSQRGGQDFVEDVDEMALEQLARGMVAVEDMTNDLHSKLKELDDIVLMEDDRKAKLEPLIVAQREKAAAAAAATKEENPNEASGDADKASENQLDAVAPTEENGIHNQTDTTTTDDDTEQLQSLQMELGRLTMQKQRILFDIGRILSALGPQQDAVESQRRHLNYVKSDISTDKTVCEISGNFMSARDADERIAAHYAGKQYVGWKLVRDKLAQMIRQYGHYGPPPPGAARPSSLPPPSAPPRGSDRYRPESETRGGGGGRWERHGPSGGGPPRDRQGHGPPRGGGSWRR